MLSLILLSIIKFHAIYIGMVSVTYHPVQTEIKVKVFQDDFRDALRNAFGYQKVINELNEEHVASYLKKHLKFTINAEEQATHFQDIESINEIYLITFKMHTPEDWETLEVDADFLMELFPAQSNVIQVRYGEESRVFRVTGKEPSKVVGF